MSLARRTPASGRHGAPGRMRGSASAAEDLTLCGFVGGSRACREAVGAHPARQRPPGPCPSGLPRYRRATSSTSDWASRTIGAELGGRCGADGRRPGPAEPGRRVTSIIPGCCGAWPVPVGKCRLRRSRTVRFGSCAHVARLSSPVKIAARASSRAGVPAARVSTPRTLRRRGLQSSPSWQSPRGCTSIPI